MNVLFVYTNIDGYHTQCYSFGLASIVSVTKAKGHSVKVETLTKKKNYQKVLDTVASFKPRIIGFTSVSSQFSFVKELSAMVKEKFPEVITVCGGVHATISPECITEAKGLDAIFVGESENSFVEFLNKVEKKEDYRGVDNLAYAEKGAVKMNKLKPLLADLDGLPYTDKEICPYGDTIKRTGYAPFYFSRGCPYLCSYCSNHKIANRYGLERNTPRYRSVESSIREIEEAKGKFDIKTVWIQDDIFGVDKRWRNEFCAEYKKRIKTKFICLLRVNVVDEEFMRLLKDAGCFRVFIGIESGNEFVRKDIMNRHMTNEQIVKAFAAAHKYGLETVAINMIGLPGETEEMLQDTIKLNRGIAPTITSVNIFYPYKGTKLGDQCFEKGLVDEGLYSDFSKERRETVLNFPGDYRKRLEYYYNNWEVLVYPRDYKRHFLRFLRKTFAWRCAFKLKRVIAAGFNLRA